MATHLRPGHASSRGCPCTQGHPSNPSGTSSRPPKPSFSIVRLVIALSWCCRSEMMISLFFCLARYFFSFFLHVVLCFFWEGDPSEKFLDQDVGRPGYRDAPRLWSAPQRAIMTEWCGREARRLPRGPAQNVARARESRGALQQLPPPKACQNIWNIGGRKGKHSSSSSDFLSMACDDQKKNQNKGGRGKNKKTRREKVGQALQSADILTAEGGGAAAPAGLLRFGFCAAPESMLA